MAAKKKHVYHRTEIEHHADKSHTVRHIHKEPAKSKSYAAADLDAVHDGMQDHLNPAEPMPGSPAAMPAPAGAGPAAGAAGAVPPGMTPGMGA